MDCNDAIGVLAVVAILATIATVAMTTTSILLLWKPHLFPKSSLTRRGIRHKDSGHVAADCGTRKLERDLEQSPQSLSSVTTSVAASTVQLTTIEETEETIRNTSVTESFTLEEKSGIGSEPNNGSGLGGEKEGEGEGERKGEKEECESAPTTPMTPESSVRKRSRVSLSSLAGSISSKLGGLAPRRVSSGGGLAPRRVSSGGGHTAEEVVDLMREREERSSSPSSREDELECPRDSIFIQSLENVAVVEEDSGPTRDGHFILDLHFNQGESAV